MAEAVEDRRQKLLDALVGSTVWDELDALLRAEIALARAERDRRRGQSDAQRSYVADDATEHARAALRIALAAVEEREA